MAHPTDAPGIRTPIILPLPRHVHIANLRLTWVAKFHAALDLAGDTTDRQARAGWVDKHRHFPMTAQGLANEIDELVPELRAAEFLTA
jgi:hypothetical protein